MVVVVDPATVQVVQCLNKHRANVVVVDWVTSDTDRLKLASGDAAGQMVSCLFISLGGSALPPCWQFILPTTWCCGTWWPAPRSGRSPTEIPSLALTCPPSTRTLCC